MTDEPPVEGVFRAIATRDAEGLRRDGELYVERRFVASDPWNGRIYEIRFLDGEWMLAADADLGFTTSQDASLDLT